MNMTNEAVTMRLKQSAMIALYLLTAFLAVKVVIGIKSISTIDDSPTDQTRVITVSGHGEVQAVPDVATFSWTVTANGTTVEDAQNKAADMSNKAIDYLKQNGVSENDINNQSYNTNEMYDYNQPCEVTPTAATANGPAKVITPVNPCPKLIGYTTNQTVTVKLTGVKQGDSKIGQLIAGVGQFGVKPTDVYYTFADESALQQQARVAAVQKARDQAEQIAKALGVSLKKVESYNESYGGVVPVAYGVRTMASDAMAKAPTPANIPNGQQTISADVTVSYSIR